MPKQTLSLGRRTFTILFPDLASPLSVQSLGRLRRSVRLRGVVEPIDVDEQDNVLDGQARLRLAREMTLTEVPCRVHAGLTSEGKRLLALRLNAKRGLTAAQRRELVAALLREEPGRSDAWVATEARADRELVAAQRRRLEAAGVIPPLKGPKRRVKLTPVEKAQKAYNRLSAAEKRRFRQWLDEG